MVQYSCNRCGKSYNNKYDYYRHINRKIPCANDHESDKTSTDDQSEESLDELNDNQCGYCNKLFTRKDSLSKHLSQNRCRVKTQDDNQKEDLLNRLLGELHDVKDQMVKQDEEIQKLRTTQNSALQITNQQNANKLENNITNQTMNNYNFKLLAFGKEDLTHVTDEVYKKILNKGFKSVPNLVEFVHFNKNKPENNNVYISNMRDKYVLVYDGTNWQLHEKANVLQQLTDDKVDLLYNKFGELKANLDDVALRKFGRFLDHKDDEDVIASIKKDLHLLLYNNNNITKATRALVESHKKKAAAAANKQICAE